jgi:hypothetical protein
MGVALALGALVWTGICLWAAHRLGQWVAPGLPLAGQVLALGVLLPLPVIDELLAQPQFAALCREQGTLRLAAGATAGRFVRLSILPDEPVHGLPVPVSRRKQLYLDDETHQPLASIHTVQAHPGKLGRWIGAGDIPLTFPGHCAPADLQAQLARAGLRPRRDDGPGADPPLH